MPDLISSLQGRDLGHLRIIAELWGLELSAPDAKIGLQRLAPMLLDRAALEDVVQALPESAAAALDDLLRSDGRLLWSAFERRYGKVREMGAAKRDRERPYVAGSACAAEALWYRGLIARGFFDSNAGPEEYAYIPEDLLALMPPLEAGKRPPLGRAATPAEKAEPILGSDRIVDDACTLLAALRMGHPSLGVPETPGAPGHYWLVGNSHLPYPLTIDALRGLLSAAGLLDEHGAPKPEPVRSFLEAERGEALACLVRAWLRSSSFNDLRLVPDFEAEGEWKNDPLRARRAVLDFLFTVPGAFAVSRDLAERPFWSLPALVAAVRQTDPDYQRSAGEYDTWYLRDKASGEYLRGFEHWGAVDGALLRFIITGPLHWLGIVDLAASAFRFTNWAANLFNVEPPKGLESESVNFNAGSDGRLRLPRLTQRAVRYQIARFSSWERISQEMYVYRLTPASLALAGKQGLRLSHLLMLLRKHAQPTPPSLVQALERWEEKGSPARVDRLMVMRVKDPELLQMLRASKLSRFLGEPLGPTAVIVRAAAVDKLLDGLVEMGYLGEAGITEE